VNHLVLQVVREQYVKQYVILGISVDTGTHRPLLGILAGTGLTFVVFATLANL
jgi:hypothetical protein